MDAQQQEQAAFERSFAETAGIELPAPTAASPDAAAGAEPEPAAAAESAAPESVETPQGADDAAAATEAQEAPTEPPAAEDDPVLLDGLKRSELRRLLGNAAEVESLKRQLDKAHGNIGELNRRFQQAAQPAPAATPARATAPELPPELKQFEQDYPEVAQYVRAMGAAPQPFRQDAPPADVLQPVATGGAPAAQAGLDPMVLEMAVLDRVHTGWREKIGSQDFGLWLASQGEQTQTAFHSADTADAMVKVIGQYDEWATARSAAADKAAKGQQRLKAAVTPAGNAPRPQSAPTEQEAMEAAFKAVMGR